MQPIHAQHLNLLRLVAVRNLELPSLPTVKTLFDYYVYIFVLQDAERGGERGGASPLGNKCTPLCCRMRSGEENGVELPPRQPVSVVGSAKQRLAKANAGRYTRFVSPCF